MYKYRITKYDPQYRDEQGIYGREDWTSYSDIGNTYNGKLFGKDEYINTEKLYCKTVMSILRICGVKEVIVEDLESHFSVDEIKQMLQRKGLDLSNKEETIITSLCNGNKVHVDDLQLYLKLILRECFWCRFADADLLTQIEFGYDYYIYLNCRTIISDGFISDCKQEGIFIERIHDKE